jgi:hypothetical protein
VVVAINMQRLLKNRVRPHHQVAVDSLSRLMIFLFNLEIVK